MMLHYSQGNTMRIFFALLISTVLAGCAAPPPLSFSVPNVGYSTKKIDAEVKSITVSVAREDEKKGDLPMGVEAIPQMWKSALEEALNRMAIFKDDAAKKLSLSVKILAVNIPAFGADMTTKSIARYELIDRADGGIVFTQDVSTDGTVPFSQNLLGIARARESINRSVQANIGQFLQSLETVDVNKPMFPSPKQ
jgi:hypothetical protein